MRRVMSLVGLALSFVASAAFGATIELVHHLTFTPPSVGEVSQVVFADVTANGFPEVGVLGRHDVFLCDIAGDSILFHASVTDPEYIEKFVVADLTSDGKADIAYISTISDIHVALPSQHFVRLFDGALGYSLVAEDTLERRASFEAWAPLKVSAFDAVDLDNDGLKELLVSLGLTMPEYPFRVVNLALLYDHFPDSITWATDNFVGEVREYNDADYGSLVFCSDHWSYFLSVIGFELASDGAEVAHLRPNGTSRIVSSLGGSSKVASMLYEYSAEYNYVGDIGAMVAGSSRPNLATWYWWLRSWGERTNSEDSSSGGGYAMYDITSPDSLTLRWFIRDYRFQGSIVYHPWFPGYFFAQYDSSLCLFRGEDGARLACIPLPPSKHIWTTSFGDGQPRLVTYNDSSISVYRLDVSTGVDDNSPDALPASFALGAPYPNPFNGSIVLPVSNDRRQRVKIDVVNMLGQKIATVYDDELGAGEQTIAWNAGDRSSGVYFIRATTDSGGDSKKVIYLK